MIKRKCSSCGKKVERKFNYCPYCGLGFRNKQEEEDYGMLGIDDSIEKEMRQEVRIPFGLDKMMNSLMKQLEKEMGNMGDEGNKPRGFKIQISTGRPQVKPVQVQEKKIELPKISEKEIERRESLKRVLAESKVRRLPDKIVYEISVPGVDKKEDIMITQLEEGIEIKAYSKDKCYVKVIPLKVQLLGWYLKKDVLFVDFKS